MALNLRLSRSFRVGPRGETVSGPPPPGGGRHGPRMGGPFGNASGLRAALRGRRNSGRTYSLDFSVSALNLFNNEDYGTPSGRLIPTPNHATGTYLPDAGFGCSTSLAGGIFSSGSAVRRVFCASGVPVLILRRDALPTQKSHFFYSREESTLPPHPGYNPIMSRAGRAVPRRFLRVQSSGYFYDSTTR